MLSKANYDKLDENFLYKKKPIIDNSFSVGRVSGTYHCKNWTFRCYKRDGKAYMVDTYWGSGNCSHEVTDENIEEYKKIFDFREVVKINDYEIDEYEDKDLICAATDSGGYTCGHIHWVLKTAKKSQKLLIEKEKAKIERAKRDLERATEELEKYENGTHYKLKETLQFALNHLKSEPTVEEIAQVIKNSKLATEVKPFEKWKIYCNNLAQAIKKLLEVERCLKK